MSQPDLRFAIMGTGRITRRLIADIQTTPGASVTVIASRSLERAKWQADSFGVPGAVDGYDELLKRDDFDVVYIALPPSLHCEWTVAACQAGKHVLCEKPLGMSADEVRAMISAAQAADVRLLDATAWLHHARTTQFRDWLKTAEPLPDTPEPKQAKADPFEELDADDTEAAVPFRLGTLRHLSASVSFRSPFQSGDHRLDASLGGGCLLDLGWYAAGLIRFAAGRCPLSVSADGVMRDGIISRVSATMQFDQDLTATLSCGFDTATRKWCEIAGEDASIVCDDFTRPWPDKPARSWVHEASGKVHSFLEPACCVEPSSSQSSIENADAESSSSESVEKPCHQEREMIAELVRRVRNPNDASVQEAEAESYRQALQTQQILDALAESIATGQRAACC
ncbi:Predicted dehydrogenase [Neorhodopirellula lusitana]|uniref:Predicted dehydrogenase n=1 Tax=Neorhodopirellula lusitana TaxID=445327 RepID=A0ABY1QGJ9_9BACT|nr:Gfo/Idh/MocA family oxidoreductase [Neorhodopirellula lusitana]SMP69878.1 Predicted dehydrogenase [Neorhodopirellula lusitana]